ncbi:hypothetical protein GC175_14080 [bacterium]|nr:hypothetical protein [bacterium]
MGLSLRLGWRSTASSAARTLSARRRVLARGGRWGCPRDWDGGWRRPLPRGLSQRADVSWRGVGGGDGVVLAIGVVVGDVLCGEDVVSAQACPGAGWVAMGVSTRLGWRSAAVLRGEDVVSAQACPGAGWAAMGMSS